MDVTSAILGSNETTLATIRIIRDSIVNDVDFMGYVKDVCEG